MEDQTGILGANTTEPAICGALKRADCLVGQISELAVQATQIADRVAGNPPPAPGPAPNPEAKRIFGDSLPDRFLSLHEDMDAALARLRGQLARIGQTV